MNQSTVITTDNRLDISGLRALAVLSVFIYHLNNGWLSGGFVGVDVFFVISGYLITRMIVKGSAQQTFHFGTFYARRILRIFPALFVIILATLLIAIIAIGQREIFSSIQYAASQMSNFYFSKAVDYFAPTNDIQPLLHTWSLGVEEQFYLFWPLLLIGLPKLLQRFGSREHIQRTTLALVAVGSLATNLSVYQVLPQDSFYMVYTRMWEFCVGGVLAFGIIPAITNQRVLTVVSTLGLLLLLGSFVWVTPELMHGCFALIPCIAAFLLIWTGEQSNPISRLLSIKPFVFIGLISYSLYLWHWLIIVVASKIWHINITFLSAVALVWLAIALAYLSYRYVETPFRNFYQRGNNHIYNTKVIMSGLAMMLAVVLIAKGLETDTAQQWRVLNYSSVSEDIPYYDCDIPEDVYKTGQRYTADGCTIGNEDHPVSVVMFGDSHALAYFPMLKTWLLQNHLRARLFASDECPAVFSADYRKYLVLGGVTLHPQACDYMSHTVANYVQQHSEVQYVIMAMRQEVYTQIHVLDAGLEGRAVYLASKTHPILSKQASQQTWKGAVNQTVANLTQAGKKVIILSQAPFLQRTVQYCNGVTLLERWTHTRNDCAFHPLTTQRLDFSRTVYRQLADQPNVHVFFPETYLKETVSPKGVLLYRDDDHLSADGAMSLGGAFEMEMRDFL